MQISKGSCSLVQYTAVSLTQSWKEWVLPTYTVLDYFNQICLNTVWNQKVSALSGVRTGSERSDSDTCHTGPSGCLPSGVRAESECPHFLSHCHQQIRVSPQICTPGNIRPCEITGPQENYSVDEPDENGFYEYFSKTLSDLFSLDTKEHPVINKFLSVS